MASVNTEILDAITVTGAAATNIRCVSTINTSEVTYAYTYVFDSPPTTGTAYGFTLKVTPSGTYTVTWPTSVDWA
jgi:hypothetical protein